MSTTLRNVPQHQNSGTSVRAEKPVNKLSAKWMNLVAGNVMDRLETLWDSMINDGILVDGYLPFTQPPDAKTLRRMTAQQLQTMLDQPGIAIEDQAVIVDVLKDLPSTVVPEPTKASRQ